MTMSMPLSKLLSLLTQRGCAELVLPDGRVGYLNSIEREDGSGKSFNLTVMAPVSYRKSRCGTSEVISPVIGPVSVYCRVSD
jgi:hypothetical protein